MDAKVTEQVNDFFRCISLCHECVALKDKNQVGKLRYNGASVDEVALLDMAQEAGIGFFLEKESNNMTI